MRVLPLLLAATAGLAAAGEADAQTVRLRRRAPPPARPLKPLVSDTLEQALERAASRDQVVLLAVGLAADGEVPDLFAQPSVARASRIAVTLASLEYAPDLEFFRSRRLPPEKVPCVLLLDGRGNILDLQPAKVDPAVLVAAARSAAQVAQKLQEELGKALERGRELAAAGDERALLDLARPWLARHYRGFEEIDRLLELVERFGRARLESLPPKDSPGHAAALEAVATEYSDTPTQARALVSLAALRESRGEREAARALYKQVLQDLPWPENADSHASAKAALARFRQEDIRRRLEEIERKKAEPPGKK